MTSSELKKRLEKSLNFLGSELSKIRIGRASPSMVENVKITAYEAEMAVRELGSIIVSDPQNLVISPWDKDLIEDIAKGIRESELNLNPIIDADVIRVSIPQLTEERRRELTKVVSNKVEEVKGSFRNVRQEAMKDIEGEFSKKLIGEDEKFKMKDDVEDIIKEYVEKAEELAERKKSSLLKV